MKKRNPSFLERYVSRGKVKKKRKQRDRVKAAAKVRYSELQAGRFSRVGEPLYELDRVDVIRLNRYRKRVGQKKIALPKGKVKISEVPKSNRG